MGLLKSLGAPGKYPLFPPTPLSMGLLTGMEDSHTIKVSFLHLGTNIKGPFLIQQTYG